MAKGQKRGNRETRKPKQEKAAPKAENPFASLNKPGTIAGAQRPKGKS